MKKNTGYRLTETAMTIIDRMAEDKGVTRTAIVEMAVRIMAKTEGYFITQPEKDEAKDPR